MNMRMMLHFYIIPAGSIQSFDLQWKDTQPWQFRGCSDSQNVCQFSVLCNWVQFSVANCFWSIMTTCLRDMLIVVFFLGTVLYLFIYLFLLFESVMWEAVWVNNVLCSPQNAEDSTLYVSHQALLQLTQLTLWLWTVNIIRQTQCLLCCGTGKQRIYLQNIF